MSTPAQLRLAADILETGHPFEFGSGTTWNRAFDSTPFDCLKGGYQVRPVLATPPDNRPVHNPDGLTAEQVGVGYRLTVEGEPPHKDARVWVKRSLRWAKRGLPKDAYMSNHTYRLPLSVPWPEPADPYAELKAAHAAGKVIQYNCGDERAAEWEDIEDPEFSGEVSEYRIKPEPAFQLPPPSPKETVLTGKGFTVTITYHEGDKQ